MHRSTPHRPRHRVLSVLVAAWIALFASVLPASAAPPATPPGIAQHASERAVANWDARHAPESGDDGGISIQQWTWR